VQQHAALGSGTVKDFAFDHLFTNEGFAIACRVNIRSTPPKEDPLSLLSFF
jgi:hypothetical protein